MHATITGKGQVTIPKPIRGRLRLEPGDRIDFALRAHGGLRVVPVTASATRLKGMVSKPTVPVSLAAMEAAIAGGAARKR